jgi:hypothetical protein
MSSTNYERLMMGAAQEFENICWVYQLKISEIIGMGGDTFNKYLSLVSTSTAELQRDFSKRKIPPEDIPNSYFEYLLNLVKYDNNFLLELKKAFFTFIREEIHISPEEGLIFVGKEFSRERAMDREKFEDFQRIVREQSRLPVPEVIPKNENAMQKKFRLRREQVAEAKRRQAEKDGSIQRMGDSISTLVAFNVGYNFENVGNLTLFQFREILDRAQAKYKYELDIRMIAAGGDPKKIKPKHWFGKLDN